jgi:hypothetical protein
MRNAVSLLIVLAFLSSCRVGKGHDREMSPETLQMNTYCIGRNSIAMPPAFRQTAVQTGLFKEAKSSSDDDAIDVLVKRVSSGTRSFVSELRERRAELVKGGSDKVNVLSLEKSLSDTATLLRVQQIDDAYVSEIIFSRGDNVVRARLESYENSFLQAEARLLRFADAVRAGQEPTRKDFCLGQVAISGEFKEESGSFSFRNGGGARFTVDVDSYSKDPSDGGLLSRVSGKNSLLRVFNVDHRVLRSGERKVGGMRAQEWLGSAKVGEERVALFFSLETMRPAPGPLSPLIHLSLNTAEALEDGTPTTTTFTDGEAVQLWDAVVQSIQPNNP